MPYKTLVWFESPEVPERFTAFGVEWHVALSSCPTEAEPANCGRVNLYTKNMWLEQGCRPDALWSTFFHEIIHVLDAALHIKLEEDQSRLLEAAFVAFFRENDVTITQEVKT
jgi:hypothetical protein